MFRGAQRQTAEHILFMTICLHMKGGRIFYYSCSLTHSSPDTFRGKQSCKGGVTLAGAVVEKLKSKTDFTALNHKTLKLNDCFFFFIKKKTVTNK